MKTSAILILMVVIVCVLAVANPLERKKKDLDVSESGSTSNDLYSKVRRFKRYIRTFRVKERKRKTAELKLLDQDKMLESNRILDLKLRRNYLKDEVTIKKAKPVSEYLWWVKPSSKKINSWWKKLKLSAKRNWWINWEEREDWPKNKFWHKKVKQAEKEAKQKQIERANVKKEKDKQAVKKAKQLKHAKKGKKSKKPNVMRSKSKENYQKNKHHKIMKISQKQKTKKLQKDPKKVNNLEKATPLKKAKKEKAKQMKLVSKAAGEKAKNKPSVKAIKERKLIHKHKKVENKKHKSSGHQVKSKSNGKATEGEKSKLKGKRGMHQAKSKSIKKATKKGKIVSKPKHKRGWWKRLSEEEKNKMRKKWAMRRWIRKIK